MNIFGHAISMPQLFGQLLIGLINGSFYALLSLGLAVIFGMLTIVNFAHGAFYMMGAFAAYFLLQYAGLSYWWALILSPLAIGAFGAIVERLFLKRLVGFDPLYGLLLTFGLALIIQGLFQNYYGASGLPYAMPEQLGGAYNLGFMFLPIYRGWVILFSRGRVPCDLAAHRKNQARRLSARGDRKPDHGAGLRHQCAAHGHPDLWLRRRAGGVRGRVGRADLLRSARAWAPISSPSCSRWW